MEDLFTLSIFGLPLLIVVVIYVIRQQNKTRRSLAKLNEASAQGLTEPASLHPEIDPNICMGCGTCVSACPEGEILGLVNRKSMLVSPTSCIGHGACREACPTGAITLVFGSERRGVEIPLLSENFESTVPGIYIAGELGGMGLIRNAITQGLQAVAAIAKNKIRGNSEYDLIIVGAGPAGLSAALAAHEKKLRYLVLEQDTIGGTVAHYPRGKIAMTRPAKLPIVGKFQFKEASKEQLVAFWGDVVTRTKLNILTGQTVENISPENPGFVVTTSTKHYSTACVLLAMGRRGTPRKLNVEGEELPKVVYRLTDPEQYRGKHVLVVGGGDSALEAALAVCEKLSASTTLAYRSDAFSRAKPKNRERLAAAEKKGRVRVKMSTVVKKITSDKVLLSNTSEDFWYKNNAVIVCAGGVLPTPFLKRIGIDVEEKFGAA